MEELAVGSCAHLIDDGWLQIDHHTTRDVLACTSFGEERVEGIVATANRLVTWHLVIRLNTMFLTLMRQHAMAASSKTDIVISTTDNCSRQAFTAEMIA